MTEILNHHNNALEARLEVKETLPLAEQLLQYGIGISEVLAFMSGKRQIWKAFQEGPRGAKWIFRMKECSHSPSKPTWDYNFSGVTEFACYCCYL